MKVLIYLHINEIVESCGRGGPLGVAYYLYTESLLNNDGIFDFLEDKPKSQIKRHIKNLMPKPFYKCLKAVMNAVYYKKLFSEVHINDDHFLEYDIIFFHTTLDMFKARKSLAGYDGKVILQSHSPVPFAQEYYSDYLSNFEKKFFKKIYKKLPLIDKYAFERADYIIYPCPEAEESYIRNWKEYSELLENKRDNIYYLPTGIMENKKNIDIKQTREKYGVTENDFLISYIGRHNEIKGFDILKKIAIELFKENGYKVISAGNETPIKRLNHHNWIEIGYTKEADSIITSSDLFVLPNRETYFDLVMIEALSLKKIVVASRTGGNKYFEKNGVEGVFLYDTIDEAVEIIKNIKALPKEDREKLERANYKFFKSTLISSSYYKSCINTLLEIAQK